jgi:hypothetical protein
MASEKSAVNVALGAAMRSARRERSQTPREFRRPRRGQQPVLRAIERDEFSPTVNFVAKVANGLGMRLGELFARAGL